MQHAMAVSCSRSIANLSNGQSLNEAAIVDTVGDASIHSGPD